MPRKRQKIRPMKYPVGQEYAYRTSLLTMNRQLKLLLKRYMAPEVPGMVAEVTAIHLPTGEIRQDAGWQETLHNVMQRVAKGIQPSVAKTKREMAAIGPRVNEYNKEEWRKLIRSQYGVNPTAENPDRWNALLSNWSRNNALLIEDIPAKQMLQISEQTVEALRSGKSARDLADDIFEIMSDRTDVGDSRAQLIARDQIAKLNGQFTKERQEDMGIDSYTWRTVGDERVRDTHEQVDGQVFSWASPPSETDGNHPGEDYQCRCFAEPVLPEELAFQATLLEEEDVAA